jgi:AraC-like DNA-binding protein
MDRAIEHSHGLGVFVSSVLIRALVDIVQRRGVAAEALLGSAASSLLSCPTAVRVPLDEFQGLLARAVELTGEPALGLECGLWASESSFGLMTPLVSFAPSLRAALALVSRFSALLSDELRLELTEHTGTAQLRCKLHASMSRSLIELVVAGLFRTVKAFGCGSAELLAVRFGYEHPSHHRAYRAAFGGTERFCQPVTAVEFSAQALDRPHMHWQPEISAVMRAQAERQIQQLSRPMTAVESVRTFLRAQRTPQVPDMTSAARELGLSVRSLRRRLEEEQTSYRELSQELSYEWACSLLRNPKVTLQSIANALGFADPSSFHRAFRRWAGQTPLAYREAATARAASTVNTSAGAAYVVLSDRAGR